MTPLQDAILDRLMAARITRDWSGGPMHVAATVIDAAFKLPPGRDMKRQIALSRIMGFSRLFCEAMHGANAGLADEDDRRKLAITVFSALPPKDKSLKVKGTRALDIAVWMAFRAHALVCTGPCELQDYVNARVTGEPPRLPVFHPRDLPRCPIFSSWKGERVSRNCPAAHSSVAALWHLDKSLSARSPSYPYAETARESARTEAKVRGVDGAAELLIELAKRLKL
jgi:hypothetical protein